jgi:RecA-family ATPase
VATTPEQLRDALNQEFITKQRQIRQAAKHQDDENAETAAYENWRNQNILKYEDLRNQPPVTPLIDGGILYQGTTAWLAGPPGSYKSFLAIDWALSIATGRPWLTHNTTKGKILYVAGEGSRGLLQRTDAWLANHYCAPAEIDDFHVIGSGISILDPAMRYNIQRAIDETKYTLLILDTQARVTPGANENDKHEMDKFVAFITEMGQLHNTTTLTIHHSAKNGSILRGSSSIEGAADTIHVMEKHDIPLIVDMKIEKQKDAESGIVIPLKLEKTLDSLIITRRHENYISNAANSPF